MSASFVRTMSMSVLVAGLLALAGCGGGDSEPEVVTETVTVTTDESSTDTTDPSTDTAPTGTSDTASVGDTIVWNGEAFTVTDVETSDTAPVADLFGEKREAEVGFWLSFKITPENGISAFGIDFNGSLAIRGGDGVVYNDVLSNALSEDFEDALTGDGENADDFLAWIDIPEAAVSGAVLEIWDGLHTVDPDPSNPYADRVPDPAYTTRVDLGL